MTRRKPHRVADDLTAGMQAIFARLLGVSRILVQKWEAGDNTPSPMARRLMDTIQANPPAWLAAVREAVGIVC
jgi:DNA-binding transcriptional regulator YiaG